MYSDRGVTNWREVVILSNEPVRWLLQEVDYAKEAAYNVYAVAATPVRSWQYSAVCNFQAATQSSKGFNLQIFALYHK